MFIDYAIYAGTLHKPLIDRHYRLVMGVSVYQGFKKLSGRVSVFQKEVSGGNGTRVGLWV